MIRVIVWKEWRQQAAIIVGLIAAAAILIGSVAFFFPIEWQRRATQFGGTFFVVILIALAALQGLVTGAMLFAGESEERTQDFLDQQPTFRQNIWRSKLLGGLSVVAITSATFVVMMWLLDVGSVAASLACITYAVAALACAAAFSVNRKTTLGAIGVSAAGTVAVCYVPVLLLGSLSIFYGDRSNKWDAVGYWTFIALCAAAAFAWSRFRYCDADLERDVGNRPTRSGLPRSLRIAISLIIRQRIAMGVVLAIFAMTGAFANQNDQPLLLWPFGVFLAGCVMGWSVYSDDQAERVAPFLGDQRLPPARLWAMKSLPPLGFLILAFLLVTLAGAWIGIELRREPRTTWNHSLVLGRWPLLILAMFDGYAFAAFAAQQSRKMPVAVFLTLTLGLPAAAIWYPSLFNSMPIWPAAAVPFIFLLATLLLWRRWTSGRLHDRSGIARLALLFVAAAAWIGGNLWWRVAEVPDVGDPFDVAAYRRSIVTSPDENGTRLREAAAQLQKLIQTADKKFPLIGEDGLAINIPWWDDRWGTPSWDTFRYHAPYDGLPATPGVYDQYLAFLFNNDWAAKFADSALAPPDRMEPMADFWTNEFKRLRDFPDAVGAFLIRARMRLSQGKPAEALDDIGIALAAVRHGLHRTNSKWASSAAELQAGIVRAAQWMLRDPAADMTFIRGLASLLAKHEESLPPFADIVKSTYIATMPQIGARRNLGDAFSLLMSAPWELERVRRLTQIAFTWFLSNDGTPKLTESWRDDYNRIGLVFEGNPYDPKGRLELLGHYDLYSITDLLALRRQFFSYGLTELHALRIALAAAIYQADNGKSISTLDDLVPKYLTRLPRSYTGDGQFRFQIADGGEKTIDDAVAVPGQGLIVDSSTRGNIVFVPIPAK